jgi:hypothetical protein
MLNAKKVEKVAREDIDLMDRGVGTMSDVATIAEMDRIASFFWSVNTEAGLKFRADFMMSKGLSCRGDNLRRLKLSEIGIVEHPNVGPNGAMVWRAAWRRSKKNQYGNVEQSTMLRYKRLITIRHKDVRLCPVGSLAFYFFARFQIGDEPWPDFEKRAGWYNIHVIKGVNQWSEMQYSTQYKTMCKAYVECGIQSSTKTQTGRKAAASHAENSGASADSCNKQGGWAVNSRNGAYSNNVVAWEAVLVSWFFLKAGSCRVSA